MAIIQPIIQPIRIPSWDELFMRMVYLVSSKSKDNRTKIGAVLVRDRRMVSAGFNGFPEGVDDDVEERYERPLKYEYVVHAEHNAVLQCAFSTQSSEGTILYTNGVPCGGCAKAVLQGKIQEVVVHVQWQEHEKTGMTHWQNTCSVSSTMFAEKGIRIRPFDQKLGVKTLMNGQIIEV